MGKKACIKNGFLLIPLLALSVFGTVSCSKKAPPEKPRTAPVSVTKAAEKDVPVEINAIGEMEAYSSVAVKSQVNGPLLKVHFSEGGYVKKESFFLP